MTIKITSAPPLPDELLTALHRMRLPYLRAAAPEILATAKAQRWADKDINCPPTGISDCPLPPYEMCEMTVLAAIEEPACCRGAGGRA